MTDVQPKTITFTASDGWKLTGDLYEGDNPQAAILISAGTGFPRRFYRHIANYLAQSGALVLTFDYRGIGDSGSDHQAFLGIDYPDWGRFDMVAATDALSDIADGLPVNHVAHSVGGHFIGLMTNHEKISRHAFVSVGTGYFGNHHWRYRPLEVHFWWGMGTYSLLRHGYINNVGGWQGEPLPPKLFKTWRRWSHRRSYFKPDLGGLMSPDHYAEVTAPIRSWLFTDDPIATPAASSDLLSCYPNAPHEVLLKSPKDFAMKRIGHDGAFRRGNKAIWQEIRDWVVAKKP